MESDFDECFRHEYPRLVALGVAMSGSPQVARELAQETMLRAFTIAELLPIGR